MDFNRLYLNNCFLCSVDSAIICLECFDKYIRRTNPQKCHVCGKVVYSGLLHKECKDYTYLDGVVYLSEYSELIRELIFLGKYSGSYIIFKELAEYLITCRSVEFNADKALITSVPLHNSRFLERGFNQAEIFGKHVGKLIKIPYLNLLSRKRKSKKQSNLDKEERFSNIANLFEVRMKSSLLNSFERIYICDDIYTTGRTLGECAKALREVYQGEIIGVVVAKV